MKLEINTKVIKQRSKKNMKAMDHQAAVMVVEINLDKYQKVI